MQRKLTDEELQVASAWVDRALRFRGAVPEARTALEYLSTAISELRERREADQD